MPSKRERKTWPMATASGRPKFPFCSELTGRSSSLQPLQEFKEPNCLP
jgi:hypothetical protein